MTERRPELYAEYAVLTRALRVAAEGVDLAQASRLLATRQRLIDEARSLDAADGPLSGAERRVLESALVDEAAALVVLDVQRQCLLLQFQEVARKRRAYGGYRGLAEPAATALEKRV